MIEIKIDDDIPPPPNGRGGKYPWLDVGQSFFLPLVEGQKAAMAMRLRKSRGLGIYRIKTREENGVLGVRIWRVE